MTPIGIEHSYIALRARPSSHDSDWWTAVRRRRDDAPVAIRALLVGRTRVELSRREADEAIRWASAVTGWEDEPGAKPIFIYPQAA